MLGTCLVVATQEEGLLTSKKQRLGLLQSIPG